MADKYLSTVVKFDICKCLNMLNEGLKCRICQSTFCINCRPNSYDFRDCIICKKKNIFFCSCHCKYSQEDGVDNICRPHMCSQCQKNRVSDFYQTFACRRCDICMRENIYYYPGPLEEGVDNVVQPHVCSACKNIMRLRTL